MDNPYDAVELYSCLIKIMDHYGYDHQIFKKVPEEIKELTDAYGEYKKNPSRKKWLHIIEEAADCFVMLEQFQMLITPPDKKEFDRICLEKVHREVGRIEKSGVQK